MKKNNNGFTLVEALVSLGILGIVAALVLPPLMSDTGRIANSTSLARAKELVEQGMLNIIQTANRNAVVEVNGEQVEAGIGVTTLAAIRLGDLTGSDDATDIVDDNNEDDDNLITKTTALTGMKAFGVNNYAIREYEGDDGYDIDGPIYKIDKSDAIIIYRPITDEIPNDIAEDVVLTRITIDVNGESAPNRLGRDVFVFGLANNGHLVPAGSAAYNNNIMGQNLAVFPDTCTDDNIGDGLTCAARVVAEGWKINY